jgi:hypothetical protein
VALCIDNLFSGGLIVNYVCSSACAHCAYRSSPRRDKSIITPEQTAINCRAVRRLGCRSLHIGGGEPFLKPQDLLAALGVMTAEGVGIEYIETNSSWYSDHEKAVQLLGEIRKRGCDTLLISIDPFHNEFIPFAKVKGVMAACRDAGIQVFPWQREYWDEIDAFDDACTHTLDEYAARYGADYVQRLAERYGPTLSGRALDFLLDRFPERPLDEIVRAGQDFGPLLAATGHFHVDLYGFYLPPGLPGIGIRVEDLGTPLSPEQYPFVTRLHAGGLAGVLKMVREDYGFEPASAYRHPRELLDRIAAHVVQQAPNDFPDLQPREYYGSPDATAA